ncbi:MAG: universal stress protein [Acidimicrobiales bacterium]
MKVIIATDGSLNAKKAARLGASLADESDEVIVLTVVEVPRQLLEAIRSASGLGSDGVISPNVGLGTATEGPGDSRGWIGDDAVIARYIDDQRETRTGALAAELAAQGVTNVRTLVRDSENVAAEILNVAAAEDVDVVCIGTLGLGRFEGLLGSISTKVARGAKCSVLLVR